MPELILLRHGESIWNRDNRFTGWTDVDLSEKGVLEASQAARLLRNHEQKFDLCLTSLQRRAIKTLWILLEELDLMWIEIERSWRLNERHYGALQGANKDELRAEVGEEQVYLWRRSFSVRPPALGEDDPRFPGHDPRYAQIPDRELPRTESLSDCIGRILPFWKMRIEPAMMAGRTPLIVAHGNSLRGLVMQIDGISEYEISKLEIPTGRPLVYSFDEKLRTLGHRYIGG